jgi:hypothetical protein
LESVGFLQMGQFHFMRMRRRTASVRVAPEECFAPLEAEPLLEARVEV